MTDMIAVQNLFPLGWEHYLLGGLCIGLGVSLLFVMTGLVGGMSTVFSSTWSFVVRRPFFQQIGLKGSRIWRLEYTLGLIVGALLWWLMLGGPGPETTAVPAWQLLVVGFIAGFGARLGHGCTSGHGICGLGSLQWPSAVAVVTFMITAMITANLVLRLQS